MNKIIILFLLITTPCLSQLELRIDPYLKGEIVLKSGEIKKGFIKLNGSAFKIKFKKIEDQKKSEKIDVKTINKIIIYQNSYSSREFYYKKTDSDKFNKFVELIYSGKYNIYLYSRDNLSLFYKDVDRSNVRDFLSFDSNYQSVPYYSVSEIKKNLAKVVNPKYLLDTKKSEVLNFI